MCNRYANLISYRQYVEEFSETRIPLLSPLPSRAPTRIRNSDRGSPMPPGSTSAGGSRATR